jgi:hypothetical protein
VVFDVGRFDACRGSRGGAERRTDGRGVYFLKFYYCKYNLYRL